MDFDPRYLAAKKSVDDRALSRHVWETLCQALPQATQGKAVQILEVGAGIGTMLERVVERGLLRGSATYVATDNDPRQLRAARDHLVRWAARQGHTLLWSGTREGRLHTPCATVAVVLRQACFEELSASAEQAPFHLLIAHAVLDLVDFSALLPQLLSRLIPGGLAYLTCNFDGETVFSPVHEKDQDIIGLYHASMDRRLPGASHTGRRLHEFLMRPGLDLLATGAADWVIRPHTDGYAGEEAQFLHTIIATVEGELAKHNSLPSDRAVWARLRHQQVEAGELTFRARHLDFLARRSPP